MADDFWTLVLGLGIMCAGILLCCVEGIRLLYPSMWDRGDFLGDLVDREVAIVIKMFFGCACTATGIALVVYTPSLSEFFDHWNAANNPPTVAVAPAIPLEALQQDTSQTPSSLPRLPGASTSAGMPTAGYGPNYSSGNLSNSSSSGSNSMSFGSDQTTYSSVPSSVPSSSNSFATPAPAELLDRDHELLLGHVIRPPRGFSFVQAISHDGPGFWRSTFCWHSAAEASSYDLVIYGGDFAIPSVGQLAQDSVLKKVLPPVVKAVPGSAYKSAKLPGTAFDTGAFQGVAISAEIETHGRPRAATVYLVPTPNAVIAVLAAGVAVESGKLRSALDASVLSLKRHDSGSSEFELQGYLGEIATFENPWLDLTP